jgi:hypothetical protein
MLFWRNHGKNSADFSIITERYTNILPVVAKTEAQLRNNAEFSLERPAEPREADTGPAAGINAPGAGRMVMRALVNRLQIPNVLFPVDPSHVPAGS